MRIGGDARAVPGVALPKTARLSMLMSQGSRVRFGSIAGASRVPARSPANNWQYVEVPVLPDSGQCISLPISTKGMSASAGNRFEPSGPQRTRRGGLSRFLNFTRRSAVVEFGTPFEPEFTRHLA